MCGYTLKMEFKMNKTIVTIIILVFISLISGGVWYLEHQEDLRRANEEKERLISKIDTLSNDFKKSSRKATTYFNVYNRSREKCVDRKSYRGISATRYQQLFDSCHGEGQLSAIQSIGMSINEIASIQVAIVDELFKFKGSQPIVDKYINSKLGELHSKSLSSKDGGPSDRLKKYCCS